MKATKQLIERNLKFTSRYMYLEVIRGSIENGQLTSCENCGKLITNMVKVGNAETKVIHYIGTDCAETLSKAKCLFNNGSQTDYHIDIYALNKASRFVTELNKGKKYFNNGIFLTVETDKGKTIDCYIGDLEKYYPNHIQK